MWFRRSKPRQILFFSASPVDDVWVRSTALACHAAGLSVEVAIVGDCSSGVGADALLSYRDAGIAARGNTSFSAAARIPATIVVTASSGLDRAILPTRAKYFVHMPHSIVSLHMIYPEDAFDGYDVLFAAGPHHITEWNAIHAARAGTQKPSYPVGYGKLDLLQGMLQHYCSNSSGKNLLIAPSWGKDNLLDRCGVALATACIDAGYKVTVRPHPLFILDRATVLNELAKVGGVTIESPFEKDAAIFEADLLVGDYSGIGFEFAALRARPVVSVDVGLKIVNPHWQRYGISPLEISYRETLGPVVKPELSAIMHAIADAAPAASRLVDFLSAAPGQCAANAVVVLQSMVRGAA